MSRSSRIAIVIKTASGGMWILEQVEEMRRRGHDVTVILPGVPGALQSELSARGIRTVASPFDFVFRPTLSCVMGLWRLRQLLKKANPDVVMYHLYASTLAVRIASIGLRLVGVQMVAGPLFLESRYIRLVERVFSRFDSVIICGCLNAAEIYRSIGVAKDRSPVICYGVDTEHYSRLALAQPSEEVVSLSDPQMVHRLADIRAKVRAELGIDQDDFLVIMVAYVYPPRNMVHKGQGIKGHEVLLDAWKRFVNEHPQSRLLLVGGGFAASGELHKQVLKERYGIDGSSSVVWLDSVGDVRHYYVAADVSISPSLSEGHGAALEAGAMAVPCIVSDAGGLPETVNSSSGWIISRGDITATYQALISANTEYRSGTLRKRAGIARDFVSANFDRKDSAAMVVDVLESQSPS